MEPVRRILVPVDFSPCSSAAISYAVRLADRLGAEISVLHVTERAPDAERRQDLDRFVDPHRSERVPLRAVVVEDRAADGIVREATGGGYDLIVIGTHGRSGLQQLLVGSVAAEVVRRAPCPVLTVRSNNGAR